MSHFTVSCRRCGASLDNASTASRDHCRDALLITDYQDGRFVDRGGEGIWRFSWLPVHSPRFGQPGPVVYRSQGLSGALGLTDLSIVFSGYWPERTALMQTCTFKELEAAVALQNSMENGMVGLVVASAGNTARAFSHLSVVTGFPVVIVVPRMCLMEMWYLDSAAQTPTLVVGDGDYADSIDVAKRVAATLGFPYEGGVKNIAKRDGLGIVLMESVSRMGTLPTHYFQAVGSGAGAIGVWEMAERFVQDGRFGSRLPLLHLAQNLPFAPMVKAWDKCSRDLFPEDLRPELIGEITTRVLSTRYPAYAVTGGVFDALVATGGKMYGIENDAVFSAMDLFEKTEGIDIVPAAGVAVAALRQAAETGTVGKDDSILLNITGGGEKRLGRERKTYDVEALFISKKISEKEIREILWGIMKDT